MSDNRGPDSPNVVTELSQALELMIQGLQSADYEFASDIGRQILRQQPRNARVAGLMALICQKSGQLADAEKYWRLAFEVEQAAARGAAGGSAYEAADAARATLIDARTSILNSPNLPPPGPDRDALTWPIDTMLGLNPTYYSQSGQDRFIATKFFGAAERGVFVDIGAHDGITGNNTLHFEKFRSWTGLCIEPSPHQFQTLVRRRSAECLNAAISNFSGKAKFLEITEGLHQMSCLVANVRPNMSKLLDARPDSRYREIEVPVTTFAEFAASKNLVRVDYCSIDAEGAELDILRGIDFGLTKFGVISVENPAQSNENLEQIRQFMSAHDYSYVKTIGSDDIFVAQSFSA